MPFKKTLKAKVWERPWKFVSIWIDIDYFLHNKRVKGRKNLFTMRAKNSHAQRETPLGTTVLLGVPSQHPQLWSPQDFNLSECVWRTHRMRLLKIYFLHERTMLEGHTEGKTQGTAKCLTFKVQLCWIASICSSSSPSSTLFFTLFFPPEVDLYELHEWASLPF